MNNPTEILAKARARQQLPTPEQRRQIRQQAGLSLRDIANAIGVTHPAVRAWEQGSQPRNPHHQRTYTRLLRELDQENTMTDTNHPPTTHRYCTHCGAELETTTIADGFDPHDGQPITATVIRCPSGHQSHPAQDDPLTTIHPTR